MAINKKRFHDGMTERGKFAMIPNEIWERRDLDFYAKTIWCYLVSKPTSWDSSRNNLARNLGFSVNTVTKCVKILQDKGMLRRFTGGNGSWNFEILPPTEWITSDPLGESSDDLQVDHIRSTDGSPRDPHLISNTQQDKTVGEGEEELATFERVARKFLPYD